jgi:spermidine synthase
MQEFCRGLYPVVDYAYTTIPTYPSGQIGFILCGLNPVSIQRLVPSYKQILQLDAIVGLLEIE